MSYLVLARKYRPQTFDEVYAQEQVTDILKNAIKMGRIAHSYLFTGPRGVGKTSLARIFAKSLNCEKGPTNQPCNVCPNCVEITKTVSTDVIEIDGASNTGVDDIRDLQKELMYSPASSKYKIYIIDEVHMLSKNAFNALLKTLEEPPDDVIFIFATTEPHKVLPTIISRCQRYDFRRIPIEAIVSNLKHICKIEEITIEDEALYVIARKADGGMRDALSLMDQILSLGKITIGLQDVLDIFGIVNTDINLKIMEDIYNKNVVGILQNLHMILDKGYDLQEFLGGLLEWIRNVLLVKLSVKSSEIAPSHLPMLEKIAENFNQNQLLYLMTFIIKTKTDLKKSENPLLIVEMAFIKLTKLSEMNSIESILQRISDPNFVMKVEPQSAKKQFVPVGENVNPPKKIPTVKHSTVEIKKDIIREVKSEKPNISEITIELLEQNKEMILKKIKLEAPVAYTFFQKAKIQSIKNNFIHYLANSNLSKANLIKNKAKIAALISKHFGVHAKVDFNYIAAEVKKEDYIKNPTLQDVEKHSENLANLIKLTDSIIIQE